MAKSEYTSTTATADFIVPVNPGTAPIYSVTDTTTHIAKTIHPHGENCRAFQLYHDVEKSLCKQMTSVNPKTFLEELQDPILGLGQVTYLQMLTNLRKKYGTTTQSKLDNNEKIMAKVWNLPTPIEDLF